MAISPRSTENDVTTKGTKNTKQARRGTGGKTNPKHKILNQLANRLNQLTDSHEEHEASKKRDRGKDKS